MKKLLAVLLVSLIPAVASAWPSLGDDAKYDAVVTAAGGGQSATGELQIQTSAIDAVHDQLTLQVTTVFLGQSSTDNQTVKLSDMQRAAQIVPYIVAQCAQQGGAPESLTTPAGTFNTCKMKDDDDNQTGFIWYADVVFGWVRQIVTQKSNGQTDDITLKSFSLGH